MSSPPSPSDGASPTDPMVPETPTLIERKNVLKEKAGGGLGPRSVQAANLAAEKVAEEFSDLLSETLGDLLKARGKATPETFSHPVSVNATSIFKYALDMKSSGTLCGYPLVTRVAHSLCRLLTLERGDAPVPLVDAHIDSLRAILREQIKAESHPVASRLAEELEMQVFALKQ